MKTTPCIVTCLAALACPSPTARGGDLPAPPRERVYFDAPDEQGNLEGGWIWMDVTEPAPTKRAGPAGAFTTILDNGPPSNRIDIVAVGDGYLASQLGAYATQVDSAIDELFTWEPFATYQTFFNVHRVDVISNESGVDNDPVQGISRDTALDMGFWCNGIERLLCVNVGAAYAAAVAAPGVDQVLVAANSTKYGGAGYTTSNLATFSGGNFFSAEVAIHEFGHSLGDLADEYDYGGPITYTGGEPPDRNVSIRTAAEMALAQTKWANWLGDPGVGYGGPVNTYQGAMYSQFGIYRPTPDSKMRSLGQPFNRPSAEALVIEFYGLVDPIDDATPPGELAGDAIVFVDPVDPAGPPLTVQWSVDGTPLAQANETTLDLGQLALAIGPHALTVTVVDPTTFVRDEVARAQHLTGSREWTVFVASPCSADIALDGNVDALDLLFMLAVWGTAAPEGDLTGPGGVPDGIVDALDFLVLISQWGSPGNCGQ